MICPKCHYERKPVDHCPDWQCPSCGVAYNKVQTHEQVQIEIEDVSNNMGGKVRLYLGAAFGVAFFSHLLWSTYDNITLGRERCEESCLSQGAVDFTYVSETKRSWWQKSSVDEREARCTCYTEEELRKKKEEWNSMKETIRKYKKDKER